MGTLTRGKSEIRYEIARARWICRLGTNYYRQSRERLADYEKLRCYFALIDKLAWYKMRERRAMKLLRELKKGIERIVLSVPNQQVHNSLAGS